MATLSTNQRQLQQVERRRELADAMTQQALTFQPIRHVNQGLAQLAQAFAANAINRRADKDETAASEAEQKALAEALSGEPITGNLSDPIAITSREPVLPSVDVYVERWFHTLRVQSAVLGALG